ncbi:MAG: DUF1727 domain-containing protein [Oscillospiraceae bacterium]|nr:DUF1727 domain-containing protein [Oscillospiraceae bacterium]
MKLRFIIALILAKLSKPLLKITGHNGTDFPGKLALKICPDFLKYVAKPETIIAVTGTNGKTTVSNMTVDLLERSGKKVLNNRAGSNINSGISTALLNGVTLFNRAKYDTAVLEVDERSAKRIYPYVKPKIIAITNLFRDSIMRNAHPQYIADFLTANIPSDTKLVLNADDLISSRVAPNNARVYFGIEKMETDVTECHNRLSDIRICPECSHELRYEYLRYHHIGKAYCPACGFKAPGYDYAGADVSLENMTMRVKDKNGEGEYRLISDSIFNVYNMVTVISIARELGMSHKEIAKIMDGMEVVATRYGSEKVGNVTLTNQMAKGLNALASSRAFDYVSHREGEKELFMMMSCMTDERHWSENTSWLYDCDFEFLNTPEITHIIATGPRAIDYKLRLVLAGVDEEKIDCIEDAEKAAESLRFVDGSTVYMFYAADQLDYVFKVREKIKALAKEAAQK